MKIYNLKNLLIFLIVFALFTLNIAAYANEETLVRIIREQQKEKELKEQYLLREKKLEEQREKQRKLEEDPNYVREQQRKLEERNLRKKQIEENERKQQEIWRLDRIKRYGVSCSKNPEHIDCSFLSIEMTKNLLNSYLAKRYDAFDIVIKNRYDKPIKITNLSGLSYDNPGNEINKQINEIIKKRNKKRFPQSLSYIALVPLASWFWVLMLPAVPLMFIMPPDEETVEFAAGPIYWLYTGTWYTAASPFYYFIDKKEDKLAKKEAQLLSSHTDININPSEEIKFIVISFKQPQLYIHFKKDSENEVIKINY